jgi:predicted Zn finger-like uncharacterized protein
MFTRCPECRSVFRVTAPVLQMAAGDVRCGSCGTVFNALQTLVDDWTGSFPQPIAPGSPAGKPSPAPVNVQQELADLEASVKPGEDFEFNVPETEWQQFFQGPGGRPGRQEPALGSGFAAPARSTTTPEPPPPPRTLEEETADTATWAAFLREAEALPEPQEPEPAAPVLPPVLQPLRDETNEPPALSAAAAAAPEPEVATDLEEPLSPDPPPVDEIGTGAPEPGDAPDLAALAVEDSAVLETEPATPALPADDAEPQPEESEPTSESAPASVLDWGPPFRERQPQAPTHSGRWLAASLVAALALGGQALHYNRDDLAADPAWGGAVRSLYERLGLTLHPAWPLDAYEIRDMKAIAGNTVAGGLDIVAEIAVNGSRPVGLPVLRVQLRDRWSNPVASGSFAAEDYLAEPRQPGGLYGPGSLIPVQLTFKDPGATAQGYELDICMPHRQRGLQCRNLRDPFRR